MRSCLTAKDCVPIGAGGGAWGNVSADAAAGSLIAVADLNRQIADTAQRLNQEQHSLRLLLGLEVSTPR